MDTNNQLCPMRFIDTEFNVVQQNRVMTELTGLGTNSQEIKCDEQLSIRGCEKWCPLKQRRDRDRKSQYQNRNEEFNIKRVEVALPNGNIKHMSITIEIINDGNGEITGIIESFKEMAALEDAQEGNLQSSVSKPHD